MKISRTSLVKKELQDESVVNTQLLHSPLEGATEEVQRVYGVCVCVCVQSQESVNLSKYLIISSYNFILSEDCVTVTKVELRTVLRVFLLRQDRKYPHICFYF